MRHAKIKQFILLFGLLLPTAWCGANGTLFFDGYSHIEIKEGVVQGAPRGSTIQAFINGHTLTVAFSENVGEVAIEITTVAGGWLGNMENLESDREIVSIYLEEGDSINAFALANMLPSLYDLTGEDLTEHNNYMAMLTLYQKLYREGRNTMKLDETERATVEYLANNSTGTAQTMAQAIMMGVYGYQYDDCPVGVELRNNRGMSMLPTVSDFDTNKAMGLTVGTSPNPANTWVTVNYTLPIGANKAQLKIANVYGVVMATFDLLGDEEQKVLDLRSLASGVYTLTLYCGKLSQSCKLVIVK